MDTLSEQNLLKLAGATALLAGRQLREQHGQWRAIVSEQGRDVKLKADHLAEEIILSQLKAATPFTILTEETGWHGQQNPDQPTWIIDPLDGSFNYHQSIPFCCVAIALVKQNEPVLGVIYDFNHDELFSGYIGLGAWCNDQPIQVSKLQQLNAAVLNTGFPSRPDLNNLLQTALQQGKHFRKVRMLGSAALALAYVAAGRSDVYYEQGTHFWDVAAGCALVKAAGGNYHLTGDYLKDIIDAYASNGQLPSIV
jgi:myo-inositol-1(or 4)-monophosphatase